MWQVALPERGGGQSGLTVIPTFVAIMTIVQGSLCALYMARSGRQFRGGGGREQRDRPGH